MKTTKYLWIVLLLCMVLPHQVIAQEISSKSTQAECGAIIEDEFTSNYEEHKYVLNMSPGDAIDVSIVPLGGQLRTALIVTGPTNLAIAVSEGEVRSEGNIQSAIVSQQPSLSTGSLSARGLHSIKLINFNINYYEYETDRYYATSSGGVGVYTIYIDCTFRNPPPEQPSLPSAPGNTTVPSFGFAGLAPVDLATVARLPIPPGVPMSGAVTPNGSEILGYQISGEAGDTLDLTFSRLSGNLNLGLVVISESNDLVFQASLITTETMNTQFTLPVSGEYIAAVFRVNLLPPESPQATAFQLRAVVNP